MIDPFEELDKSFQQWWYEEGSIGPMPGMDHEEHTKRISQIAWHNGAYVARKNLPTSQPIAEAFTIVQQLLAQLAGNEELMLYRWPYGDWHIHHTNPSSSVQLGEVSGEYGCTGRTLEEAVRTLAMLLPTPEATVHD